MHESVRATVRMRGVDATTAHIDKISPLICIKISRVTIQSISV